MLLPKTMNTHVANQVVRKIMSCMAEHHGRRFRRVRESSMSGLSISNGAVASVGISPEAMQDSRECGGL